MSTLVSDEDLEKVQQQIAMVHSMIASAYANIVDTELKQPINTFLSLGHYLCVHGHQFTANQESERVGSLPYGYYNRKNNNAYIWVPSCGVEGFQPYAWSTIMKNTIAELYQKSPQKLIIDFRGCSGGSVYAFYTGFAPILHEFATEDEYKDGQVTIRKLTKTSLLQIDKQTGVIIGDQPHVVTPQLRFKNISVLIDRNSASCGEILPYLLKKNTNAITYGERTTGAMSSVDDDDDETILGVAQFSYSNTMKFEGTVMEPLEPDVAGIPKAMWVESEWPSYYRADGSKVRKGRVTTR